MASRGIRIAFAVVAWLFVGAVLYQVFLAGVGLFMPGVDQFSAHRQFGWLLHGGPLPVLLLGWAAHAGRRTMWLAGALFLLVAIQPFLPGARLEMPWLAALHPVNALLISWLGVVIAWRATALAREPMPVAAAPPEALQGASAERT